MRQKSLLNGLQMSSFDMKVKMEKLKKSASQIFFLLLQQSFSRLNSLSKFLSLEKKDAKCGLHDMNFLEGKLPPPADQLMPIEMGKKEPN